jgi:hypothetical protein
MLTRAALLRLGAVAAIGGAVAPAAARAALPVPTPVGDDEGYLTFGAIAERAALNYYRRATRMRGAWSSEERAFLARCIPLKVQNVQRLTTPLGADAPSISDFTIELPSSAFASKANALSLGRRLEGLLIGVYVEAVAFTADPASRLLLGRLLSSATASRAGLSAMAGQTNVGLPDPIDLQTAGDQLDRVLRANGYPTA